MASGDQISAGDFRNGITLEIDGNVVQIIEFQHVKPGKGAAFVRTKMKDVINGGVVEKTFRPTEKFPQRELTVRHAVSLQRRRSLLLHERRDVRSDRCQQETVGDALKFVKENEKVLRSFPTTEMYSLLRLRSL
jgi:elongation factor P